MNCEKVMVEGAVTQSMMGSMEIERRFDEKTGNNFKGLAVGFDERNGGGLEKYNSEVST